MSRDGDIYLAVAVGVCQSERLSDSLPDRKGNKTGLGSYSKTEFRAKPLKKLLCHYFADGILYFIFRQKYLQIGCVRNVELSVLVGISCV